MSETYRSFDCPLCGGHFLVARVDLPPDMPRGVVVKNFPCRGCAERILKGNHTRPTAAIAENIVSKAFHGMSAAERRRKREREDYFGLHDPQDDPF